MNFIKRIIKNARGRSPWLFHMNTGSCNGCDIELIASLTPRFDVEQVGIKHEASPRHCDIVCVTGPVTNNAVNAVRAVYGQVCHPKAVVAIGSCPATCNAFVNSPMVAGPLSNHMPVDVYVPGCPPRPSAIIEGIAKAAAILAERDVEQSIALTKANEAARDGKQSIGKGSAR